MSDVVLLYAMSRQRKVSRKAFARWLARPRARLVRHHASVLGIRSYVQRRTLHLSPVNFLMRAMQKVRPPLDAVERIVLSRDALDRALDGGTGHESLDALRADEAQWLDFSRSAVWVADPHVLQEGRPALSGVQDQLVWLGRGLPSLTDAQFQAHYLNHHGPLACRYSKPLGMDRYVQLHRRDDPLNDALQRHRGTGEPFPVSAEIIPDNETMLSREYRGQFRSAREVVSEDEDRHIDFTRSHIWMTRQTTVL